MPIKDHTPESGARARKTTDKRGGMVEPRAEVGPSHYTPKFGQVPNPDVAKATRATPTDTNPRLPKNKVAPIVTRATPKPRTENPF